MSDDTTQKIGQVVNGFDQLAAREVDGNQYRVLSWRNDSVTAHRVNIHALTCTCEDEAYNTEGHEICDHLAKALFVAPAKPDMTEAALWTVVNHHDRILSGTPREPTYADTPDPEPSEATQEEVEEAVPETAAEFDPVTVATKWLETGFAQPEHVEIEETTHDGTPGVSFSPDNQAMPDGVYESFKGLVNAVDGKTVHVGFGDDPCATCGQQDGEFWYHVPTSTLEEWA